MAEVQCCNKKEQLNQNIQDISKAFVKHIIKIVREEAPLKENVTNDLIFEDIISFDASEVVGQGHDSLKAQT